MHMVQIAHLGREHVKVRRIRGGTCKSQENTGGYLRSGDDLKKTGEFVLLTGGSHVWLTVYSASTPCFAFVR